MKGLHAIVTGAGSGIGHATASLLLTRGAAGLDLNSDEVPVGFHGVWCDVGNDASVRTAVASACSAAPPSNGTGCST